MTNPDSNFDYWLYKIGDKIFYPLLVKRGNYVKSIAINKKQRLL